MRLECDVTPDDVADFVRHVARTEPGFRKQYIVGFTAGPVMGLLLLLLTGHSSMWISFAKVAAVTALFTGFYMYFYRKQITGNARRAYGKDSSEGPLGRRVVTIGPEGIEEVSDHAASTQKWSGIRKVEEVDSALYLFNAPASAVILPKRAFASAAAIAEFLDAVARFRSGSRA